MLDNSKTITAVTYNGNDWPIGKPEQSKTLTLGASAPSTVTPDSGKVLSSVPVALDTSVIKAENIAKGVTVLGVDGSLEAGGSAGKKPYTMTIRINKYNTSGSGGSGSGSESTSMRYYVSVSITDGDNTKTVSSRPTVTAGDRLKNTITDILTNKKDEILGSFPTNQWIYQWIISSELDGTLQSFFTAFGVTGNENLMNALLNGGMISDLEVGKQYDLSFEGY